MSLTIYIYIHVYICFPIHVLVYYNIFLTTLFVEAFEHETKLSLSKDGKWLYAVDHNSRTGDFIKIYDLTMHAELTLQVYMQDRDMKSIQLVGNDK